jgi:hypothetical protein
VVTKVDAAELLDPFVERALAIAGMVLLGILLAAVTTACGSCPSPSLALSFSVQRAAGTVHANAQYPHDPLQHWDAVNHVRQHGVCRADESGAEDPDGWNEADAKGCRWTRSSASLTKTTREAFLPGAKGLAGRPCDRPLPTTPCCSRVNGKEYPIADSAAPVFTTNMR